MMFPDVPSMYFLGQIYHDVGVGDAAPVKQHRYRPNAIKQQYHKEEIKYLLADDFIEPSCRAFCCKYRQNNLEFHQVKSSKT